MEDCDIKHKLSQVQVDFFIPSQLWSNGNFRGACFQGILWANAAILG